MMTDIVMALRLRIEDDEAPLHDHELHRHSLKAIQELRGKLQTVAEAYTRMHREAGAEINRLRNMVDQCDHHEHSLQDARAEVEQLRVRVKTLTGQLHYIGSIATATADNVKRNLRIDGGWNLD